MICFLYTRHLVTLLEWCRYGVGALWPKFGQGLALALQMDRVYVTGALSTSWEDNAYCGKGAHFDSCYFLPFSNCTLEHALQGRSMGDVPDFNGNIGYTPNASRVWRRLLDDMVRPCLALISASPTFTLTHIRHYK